MHVVNHTPPEFRGNVQKFGANSNATLQHFDIWNKPKGLTMCNIFAVGAGSGGTGGVVGALSTAAGGAGGGGGGQTIVTIPLAFLPERLYVCVGYGGRGVTGSSATAVASFVATIPILAGTNVANIVCYANGGSATTAPTGATAGVGATAVAVATIANCAFAARGTFNAFAGAAGGNGGTTGAAPNITIPVTGIITCGGSGGAGLPGSGNGLNGGNIVGSATVGLPGDMVPTATSVIYNDGGVGGAAGGAPGNCGRATMFGIMQGVGGTGGASGAATSTAGGGRGGDGIGPGCGGGGGGGALTGSPANTGGHGGDGLVIFTCW